MINLYCLLSKLNKDENTHRFVLSGVLLEREFWDIIHKVLYIIHSKDYTRVTHYPK